VAINSPEIRLFYEKCASWTANFGQEAGLFVEFARDETKCRTRTVWGETDRGAVESLDVNDHPTVSFFAREIYRLAITLRKVC
jgi:hypothetical protein